MYLQPPISCILLKTDRDGSKRGSNEKYEMLLFVLFVTAVLLKAEYFQKPRQEESTKPELFSH
jgi:hypothetical protein